MRSHSYGEKILIITLLVQKIVISHYFILVPYFLTTFKKIINIFLTISCTVIEESDWIKRRGELLNHLLVGLNIFLIIHNYCKSYHPGLKMSQRAATILLMCVNMTNIQIFFFSNNHPTYWKIINNKSKSCSNLRLRETLGDPDLGQLFNSRNLSILNCRQIAARRGFVS